MAENMFVYSIRRRGATTALRAVLDAMGSVERAESHGSRRYKLIKHITKTMIADPDPVLETGDFEGFKYHFDKGELVINDEEDV